MRLQSGYETHIEKLENEINYLHSLLDLVIPAAEEIPTAFKEKRYIHIGSSKANLKDYPKREIQLFKILDGRVETIEILPAKYQELTFSKLYRKSWLKKDWLLESAWVSCLIKYKK